MATGETTVGAIKTRARQRTDRVGSDFFTESELTSEVAASYKELYDLIIQKFGDDYFFADPYEFTTDGTNETYDLPEDFYKLFGVDLSLTSGNPDGWIRLKQFTKAERARYAVPNFQSFYGITNLRYRLRGDTIWFTPRPMAGQKIRLLYAPRPADITADADVVDGVSGWEEYIVTDLCIKMLAKEESDPTVFVMQKQALLKRIEEAAENRNVGEAQTASDTQSNWGPFGIYSNNDGGWSY
jgi:hypothetical protein